MSETKQWMGLHNHDRHFYSPGYGDRCGKCWYCSPETPCYCCLQAEVEALREKVKQHEVVFKVQAEALKSTREQVQRVREECEYPWFFDVGEHAGETPQGLPFVETAAVLKALDGGDE